MMGRKRNEMIASGKVGHKILILGNKLVSGNFVPKHENAQIEVINFPERYPDLERLVDYSLVILDYSAFYIDGSLYKNEQDVFKKQMAEALSEGTNICFVYYREEVPKYDRYENPSYMDKDDYNKLKKIQIGFSYLDIFSIRPYRLDDVLTLADLKRNEFQTFLKKWGATHNYFKTYGTNKIDDNFYHVDDAAIGFSIDSLNGKLIYIPFQRDFKKTKEMQNAIELLIDSCLTYITNSLIKIPEWANTPLFDKEKIIYEEINECKEKLKNAESKLKPYQDVKTILFESQYALEKSVPEYLKNQIGVSTVRNEHYKEDFWILDDSNNPIVIGEVKSLVKGFKKSSIFSLYNHREENKLDESFPALLLVNTNMQAGCWEDKDKSIDPQDYEIAVKNNILIMRVLDLVRLWFLKSNGNISKTEIINNLCKNSGWMRVNDKFEISILK